MADDKEQSWFERKLAQAKEFAKSVGRTAFDVGYTATTGLGCGARKLKSLATGEKYSFREGMKEFREYKDRVGRRGVVSGVAKEGKETVAEVGAQVSEAAGSAGQWIDKRTAEAKEYVSGAADSVGQWVDEQKAGISARLSGLGNSEFVRNVREGVDMVKEAVRPPTEQERAASQSYAEQRQKTIDEYKKMGINPTIEYVGRDDPRWEEAKRDYRELMKHYKER